MSNEESLRLWWCHSCCAVWLWNNGSIYFYSCWKIIPLFISIAFHSVAFLLKNCIGRMCFVTAGCAWVNSCRPWHHHMVLKTGDYFNATQLSVTFSYLALGVGATAPSQLPNTKSEAINRRTTKLACQGISLLPMLWYRHRLSLQIPSVGLKTRWKKNKL